MRQAHKSRGVSTGLGICNYLASLLDANELARKRFKFTDERIAIAIEREFPTRRTAFCFRGKTKTRTINEYRQRYNKGLFSPGGMMPLRRSFRFGKDGDVVDDRTGKIKLIPFEIACLNSSHKYYRERQKVTNARQDLESL